MDTLEEQENKKEIMKRWLDHPGTRLFFEIMDQAADDAQESYDEAILSSDQAALNKLWAIRFFVKKEIPKTVEYIMNGPQPNHKPTWFWQRWIAILRQNK